jgi:hypothetical protein
VATNYQRGRAFEYRARDALLKQGAVYVMRAAQSKGKADLIALWPWLGLPMEERCWVIQCKRDGRLPRDEREALLDICEETGFPAFLAKAGPKGRGVEFTRIERK